MIRTFEEINAKIKAGKAVVVTADEMTALARDEGVKAAARKVDVVTTATFSPMCSSGAMVNVGHSDPPIKIASATLNDVPVFAGLAAVDIYIGATEPSKTEGINYGGAHVIEDLVNGKTVKLIAESTGTDCYPRRHVETYLKLDDVNEAYLFNPRNAYQNYGVAVNTSTKTIHTYMGVLLPNISNATYCTSGQLSPLLNDPTCRTIGIGTRIFLCGAQGFVAWQGTQFNPSAKTNEKSIPETAARTLAVVGDLKMMSTRYLRAATMTQYGVSLFVGIGVPIPILDEEMAESCAVSDADIPAIVCDYSTGTRSRPVIAKTDYAKLRSGAIEIDGKRVPTAPMTSYARSKEIAQLLKGWIEGGSFLLSAPVEALVTEGAPKPMKMRLEGED